MGTNYYLHAPKCFHCGKENEPPIHLGKSSGGFGPFENQNRRGVYRDSLEVYCRKKIGTGCERIRPGHERIRLLLYRFITLPFYSFMRICAYDYMPISLYAHSRIVVQAY